MANLSAIPPDLLSSISISNTIGALHIGTYIAVSLFGLATIQVYYYYLHHSGDGLYIKATVATIWLLELFHTLTSLHAIYDLAVTNHGNLLNLAKPIVWSISAYTISGGAIDIIVQYCFLFRLSHYPTMRPVVYFGYFLGIARLATVFATAIEGTGRTPIEIIVKTVTYFRASGAVSTALDAVVAIPMSFLLYRQEFKSARWNVKRIAFIAIESGLVAFVFSLVALVEVMVSARFTWLATLIVLSKIYSNSLMAALNSHHFWEVKVPALSAGPRKALSPRGLRKRRSIETKNINGIRIEMTNVTSSTTGYEEGEIDHMTSQDAGETSSLGDLPKHHV